MQFRVSKFNESEKLVSDPVVLNIDTSKEEFFEALCSEFKFLCHVEKEKNKTLMHCGWKFTDGSHIILIEALKPLPCWKFKGKI